MPEPGHHMKRTSRVDYGLRALIDLALNGGGAPVSNQEISKRQRIPEQYLKQILPALRRRALIASTRGPGGGHRLARPARQITLSDIVSALEGGADVLTAVGSPGRGAGSDTGRLLDEFWQEVREAVEEIMRRTTLEDLCRRHRRGQRSLTYHI